MSKVYYCIQVTIVFKIVVLYVLRYQMVRSAVLINYMCNKYYKETIKF